ncbi:MAG: hypothetical protein DRP59_11070 [Spirochaetes bacterium]|nr:MAG: hypothetical protein DRP59_11070 [Spirochaetota bacterium]
MRKKKKSSIGCLFWIALILLLVVIFLLSRTRIDKVLETTGFKEIITKNEAPEEPVVVIKTAKKTIPENETLPLSKEPNTKEPAEKITGIETTVKTEPVINENTAPAPEKKSRKSVLYFINVDDSGSISLVPITRIVYYRDSPLTKTMQSLLSGLSASELNRGIISLIPEGTKLLGISIKDSIAYINFNEMLKFNSFGEEGLKASLKQIVYTSTEFSTVKGVQLLINGTIEKYLSTEGVFVGKPLTRASF